jgi:DNA-binding MarR family transcriptional regulator
MAGFTETKMANEIAPKRHGADNSRIAIRPDDSIGYQVRRLSQQMSEAMENFVSPHGISSAQWGYLRHIYIEDGLSQRELSDRVGRQGATTVSALKRLEQAGYVETQKNKNDQRKNKVFLTPMGREFVAGLMPYVKSVEEIAFRGFSAAEARTFRTAVERMRRNFSGSQSQIRRIA